MRQCERYITLYEFKCLIDKSAEIRLRILHISVNTSNGFVKIQFKVGYNSRLKWLGYQCESESCMFRIKKLDYYVCMTNEIATSIFLSDMVNTIYVEAENISRFSLYQVLYLKFLYKKW